MNKKICSNRWFIWAIVFIVVVGVGLWAFIEYTNATMDIESSNESITFIITIHKKLLKGDVEDVLLVQ